MKEYPHIEGSSKAPLGNPCIAFYKYDGSNLRWEWSPAKGWYKFGTRKQLFDATEPVFGKAIPIFMAGMGDEIVRRVKDHDKNVQRITVFTEYFGPGSFAGKHVETDQMELRLLDVFLFKKGFMKPRAFVKTFGDLPFAPEVVYEGNLNKPFIEAVRAGEYPIWEGVVAKGEDFMVKIKTKAYFQKLNEVYGTDYRLYWE
jgi:hypothetical protein